MSVYYLPGATVPEPFLAADRKKEAERKEPKVVTEPVSVDVPFIHGCKGSKGKLIVTEDWYVEKEKKRMAKQAREKRDIQIEMMQLIGKRDQLRGKLNSLDPSKKKDYKKIVAINIQLKDIEAELEVLQKESGINLNELDNGTKVGRFFGRLKNAAKKAVKKVKKFYHRNQELISGIAAIVLPVIGAFVVKWIAGLFGA